MLQAGGRTLALAAVLVLWAGAGWAQTRSALIEDARALRLERGERVVIRPAADGRLELVSAMLAAEAEALPPRPGAANASPEVAPGTVAIVLGGDGRGSTLKLDSGLSLAFDYRATATTAGREASAATCTVLPLLASYESWPGRAERAVLRGFAARETNEVVCTEPQG